MNKILLGVLFFIFASHSFSQDQNSDFSFSGHYLGLQANELIRQLVNFGDSEVPDNPYFFTYNYNSVSGDGLNVGFALTSNSIEDNDDFSNTSTKINRFFMRVGYEKKSQISKRFYYSWGVDLVIDSDKNETINEDTFSNNKITTTSTLSGWGLGPRFTINYRITDRLIIGTEANYYYKSLTNKFEVKNEDFPEGDIEDEEDLSQFNFVAPAVLWVTLRL